MHVKRQELLSSANRRVRRARRTTGRIVVSALGFGLAYYFDAETGAARRSALWRWLRRAAHDVDSALKSQGGHRLSVSEPVARASDPVVRGLRAGGSVPSVPMTARTAAP